MSKLALVTGASEGIGRSFAKRLASEGYLVLAVARNEGRLKELMDEIGPGHDYRVADLATAAGISAVASELSKKRYDLLVNNAGFAIYGRFEETGLEQIQEILRLNCESLLVLSHAFLKVARPGDSLINVSSSASFFPMPISSVYTASKSFVTSLSETLWYEQKKRGVYVLGLCPGITATKFHTRAGGKDEQLPSLLTETPEQVVAIAMKALRKRRRSVIVSGTQNYVLWLTRLLPRQGFLVIMGKLFDLGMKARK
jgi:short-subunit dehydrogenase